MLRRFLKILFFILISPTLHSQITITGKVVEKNKEMPVYGCSVYLNKTTIGAVTDKNGDFLLKNIPSGEYELVASAIGFDGYSNKLEIGDNNITVNIRLATNATLLDSVVVKAEIKETWDKWGKIFKEYFLGFTSNGQNADILNKEVIHFRFSKNQHTLYATAREPIIINNNNLGYQIHYQLKKFSVDIDNNVFQYSGTIYYKPMDDRSPQKRWIKNRQNAYHGSLRHFISALYNNTAEEEGFSVKYMGPIADVDKALEDKNFINTDFRYAREATGLVQPLNNKQKKIAWQNYLAVTYNKTVSGSSQMPVSILSLKQGTMLTIDQYGNWSPPQDLFVQGYWSWNSMIANILPINYTPENLQYVKQKQVTNDTVAVNKNEMLEEVKVTSNISKSQRKRLESVDKRYSKGVFSMNLSTSFAVDVLNDPSAKNYSDIWDYIVAKIPALILKYKNANKGLYMSTPSQASYQQSHNGGTITTFETSEPIQIELFYINESEATRNMVENVNVKDVALIKYFKAFGLKPGLPPAICIYLKKTGDKGYFEK